MSQESNSPAPQPMLSPETLIDGPWFENVKRAYEVRTKPSHPPKWLVPVIGFSIAGLLWLLGYRKTAIVGGSIVATMFLLEFVHPPAARKVQKGLAIFGGWAGQGIGWLLLCPMFLIVGPLSRLFTRVMGADPLGRRMAGLPSYWHFGAPENARTKKTASMFCVERQSAGGRNWLGALLLLGVLGLIASEIVLRAWFGFHDPLLYQNDADCGYRMRPNQKIVTGRGSVTINNYAMRYQRDITPQKPEGVFRILLIGDSTLFGGEDLTDEETYAAIAEKSLNEKYPGKKIEVLPIGTNGWGPHHTLGWLRRNGTVGADIGIIAMSAGNTDRPRYLADAQRYLVKKPALALQTVMAKVGWDTLRYCATGGSGDYNQGAEVSNRIVETGETAFVDTAKEILKNSPECMAEAIPQICYGMNGLKGTFELAGDNYHSALKSFRVVQPQLEALGVPMRYPKDLFVGKGTVEELWRKKDHAHLGKKGHQLFAAYLVSRIEEASAGFRKYAGLPDKSAQPASR